MPPCQNRLKYHTPICALVTGSLATILWLIALRREKVEIADLKFFKIGIIAMPFVLVASLLLWN
jgi:Na+/H+ antiporter NhaD/arsenite permease-like protein